MQQLLKYCNEKLNQVAKYKCEKSFYESMEIADHISDVGQDLVGLTQLSEEIKDNRKTYPIETINKKTNNIDLLPQLLCAMLADLLLKVKNNDLILRTNFTLCESYDFIKHSAEYAIFYRAGFIPKETKEAYCRC